MRVIFIHPDLGIGGAERLVIDAALALKAKGHSVQFVTAHHDQDHCFTETKDGTLDVCVSGDWLPRSFFGRCKAFFAYLRMLVAALYAIIYVQHPDLYFVDQISACIPLLRWFTNSKVLFYCHFPDQLLTERISWLKSMYRYPIDWLEESTTGMADRVLINSHFTGRIFRSTFKSLAEVPLTVLYPSLNVSAFQGQIAPLPNDIIPEGREQWFLSMNRYERKKNIGMAIRALAVLNSKLSPPQWDKIHLVIAGGYDTRLIENVEHYEELVGLAKNLEIQTHVTFVRSCPDALKLSLLWNCTALIYTPSNEHFGIVPVEAMYCKRPVIAMDSGGPRETVVDGETGFLVQADSEQVADAMYQILADPNKAKQFGDAGHRRVMENFSFESFADKLHHVSTQLVIGADAAKKK